MHNSRLLFACLLVSVLVSPAWAQSEASESLSLADAIWTMRDGTTASYADLKGEAGTLFIVWESTCAWAKRYQERVDSLQATLEAANINAYLVHTPSNPALQLRMPKKEEEELTWLSGINDPERALTEQLQATRIPQFVLVNSEDFIVYAGAFDDSPGNAEQVQMPYVQRALEALAAGEAPEVEQTRPFGCMIR